MRKLAVCSAAALIGVGALVSTPAEARDRGGAIAAGVIGGLAAGALIGAASNAHAAPAYDHSYPAHGYEYRPAYYARPYHRPVVVKHFVEDEVEECRVIVKRRFNAYGDLVVKRIRICD